MVQKYVVHKSEMHRVDEDDSGTAEWDLVIIHEDYAALENAVNALLVDVKARYPNQDLYCPFMRELERLTQ